MRGNFSTADFFQLFSIKSVRSLSGIHHSRRTEIGEDMVVKKANRIKKGTIFQIEMVRIFKIDPHGLCSPLAGVRG
jgi:hypothetical protein